MTATRRSSSNLPAPRSAWRSDELGLSLAGAHRAAFSVEQYGIGSYDDLLAGGTFVTETSDVPAGTPVRIAYSDTIQLDLAD